MFYLQEAGQQSCRQSQMPTLGLRRARLVLGLSRPRVRLVPELVQFACAVASGFTYRRGRGHWQQAQDRGRHRYLLRACNLSCRDRGCPVSGSGLRVCLRFGGLRALCRGNHP